jgi:DNA transposition AAA+ family ATPase
MQSAARNFVVTKAYRRFAAFCDACQRDRSIGVCYGPPGVGKTLAAWDDANWETVTAAPLATPVSDTTVVELLASTTVGETPQVVHSPGRLARARQQLRHTLRASHWEALHREDALRLAEARHHEADRWRQSPRGRQVLGVPIAAPVWAASPLGQRATAYAHKRQATPDPARLILIDETDRLQTAGLEQVRDIFDRSELGVVLMGMPGLEKRLARYPQLYSRVGFVHAFRPLETAEMQQLLQDHWLPAGVTLPEPGVADEEALAALVRMTEGNFRLRHRLLTQSARLVAINALPHVTRAVVEAARELLVIGSV